MWNRFFEPTDIEDRGRLRAVDTAQLLLTGALFVGALLIYNYYPDCNDYGKTWCQVMLYGSLFWLFYLGTSLIGKYKNKMIRFFFKLLDLLFYGWLLGMWIWNFVLWVRNDRLGSFYPTCNDAANFYADIFRYLGYFFIGVLIIGLLAMLCARFRPKEELGAGLGYSYQAGAPANTYGNNYGNAYGNPNPALDPYGSQMGAGKGAAVYGYNDKFARVK